MTIRELMKYKKTLTNKMFIVVHLPDTYDFWDRYITNYNSYDNIINIKYGQRKTYLVDPKDNAHDEWEEFNDLFTSFLVGNAYEYQRQWDALKAEYNPIENYDRKEDSTTTREAKTDTVHMPQLKTTSSGGTTTVKEDTSPFDSGFEDAIKSTSTLPETWTRQDAYDQDTDYGEDKSTINSRIHGNVGVTTNQQMIAAELELRAKTFINEIINDIVNKLTIY